MPRRARTARSRCGPSWRCRGDARGVSGAADEAVDRLFRREAGRAVATLIRAIGDFDLAEEAVQEAFVDGARAMAGATAIPDNPGAWITTTARNRAIDRLRRDTVGPEKAERVGRMRALEAMGEDMPEIPDERLRLIFTCCHPALAAGGAGRAHAADRGRAVDPRDRARVPGRPSRPWPSGWSGRRGRSAAPASPTACRRATCSTERLGGRAGRALPDLQRGLQRHDR